jgi:hypothetical protein
MSNENALHHLSLFDRSRSNSAREISIRVSLPVRLRIHFNRCLSADEQDEAQLPTQEA